MAKLTDTQLLVLSSASQRSSLNLLPMPNHLKGGAIPKVLHVLLTSGLVVEVEAVEDEPVWRRMDDGRETRLILTNDGLAVLGIEPVTSPDAALQAGGGGDVAVPVTTPEPEAPVAPTGANGAPVRKSRTGTKQAKLITMLKAPAGAAIAEIVEATGWRAHTARGFLAGALKKKLGLDLTSEKEAERGRVYRLIDRKA
ncbi:hypothetical protein ABB55_14020 [Prosthecomicrobium hirschii]|uniref:DUF3489 domain-containing protein n=1 Tax=Prosthecodimorpha hirschii TaxID=665126 RepID=A0A0P6VMY1_9HYPH|nr:DUF3489 domain-containing protein [Prosthecomicrobium hirschii]KPL53191.1 hypothetical protein ABB55_14020 [Prosthecomicrobium hirschii]